MNDSHHRKAEFGFIVFHRMPAGQDRPGLRDLVQSAGDNLVELVGGQFFGWKTDQVEAHFGFAAHGVDIADGVGGGDLAKDVGVVYRRGYEVSRHHDGQVIGEAINPGVVVGFVTHQQIGIIRLRQSRQQCTEPDRVDFCRSAAGFG